MGRGPNGLLHNLLLTPAAYMERSPEAERLAAVASTKQLPGFTSLRALKAFRHPAKTVQQ